MGVDHDTAAFAVASVRSWWDHLGSQRFASATTLTITADCGGSNSYRTRQWKTELQRLADDSEGQGDDGYVVIDISQEAFDNRPEHSSATLARGVLNL